MNYTAFFVALSALGVLVFVGIFGAAWMSAADQEHVRERETISVNPPTTQRAVQIPGNAPTTEGLIHSSSATTAATAAAADDDTTAAATAYTEASYSYDSPVAVDDSTNNPSLLEEPLARRDISPTDESKEDDTNVTEDSQSDDSTDLSESDCTTEVLSEETGNLYPSYENKDRCQQWLVQYDKGYGVEILIDKLELDAASHDFLLISADEDTIWDEENPIITWKITQKRTYRIPDKGTAFLLFVSHYSESIDTKPGGFRLKYTRYGNKTESDQSTTVSSVPTPPPNNKESIIVTIKSDDFAGNVQEFKNKLADEVNRFCKVKNITLKNDATAENVYLSDSTPCLATWPYSDKCIHLTMAIAVENSNSKKYELTKGNLQTLWDDWDMTELKDIEKIEKPDYKKHVIIWALLCILFIVGFSVCLLLLWRWQLRNSHIPEDEKSRPSTPIEVPPLFDYFDTRLDDPEYLPYYDSMYNLGTETSTDDVKFSYGALPPYIQPPTSSSTFRFSKPVNAGIENDSFFLEEDEEEYEIMNRASIIKEVKKIESENENNESQETNE